MYIGQTYSNFGILQRLYRVLYHQTKHQFADVKFWYVRSYPNGQGKYREQHARPFAWNLMVYCFPICSHYQYVSIKSLHFISGFPAHGLDFILSATRCRSRAMGATFSFGRKAKACRWRRVWLKNAWVQIPTQLAWFMEKIVMIMIWKWIVPSKIDGFNHQKWWV